MTDTSIKQKFLFTTVQFRYFPNTVLLCVVLLGCFFATCLDAKRPLDSQQNYKLCLRGYYGCELAKLTDTERLEVQHAASRRNLNACLQGYYSCDQSKLTEAEQAEVQRSARQRNYN